MNLGQWNPATYSCSLIFYGLFLCRWGGLSSWWQGEVELFFKNSTKVTPSGSHFWRHFVPHCPLGPSTRPGTAPEFYKYPSKCWSAPFFSCAPQIPQSQCSVPSLNGTQLLHGPFYFHGYFSSPDSPLLYFWTVWWHLILLLLIFMPVKSLQAYCQIELVRLYLFH